MKILVAVDGSEFTRRLLEYWTTHGDCLGECHQYTVLTVVQRVPPRAAALMNRETLLSYYADEGEKIFGPIRDYLDRRNRCGTFLSKSGAVAETIARTAEEGCFDLILMGTHGHTAVANIALGSVPTRVMALCRTAILLVR